MTTNKPPIAAWAPSTALHKLASRHNNAPCILTDCPAEFNDVALVRLADYERLQVECERLREHLQSMIDQTTPLEPVPGNPMWSRRIQLDEVIAERDSLRAECENLRKDAELYLKLRGLSHEKLGTPGIPCVAVPEAHNKGRYVSGEDLDAAMQEAT